MIIRLVSKEIFKKAGVVGAYMVGDIITDMINGKIKKKESYKEEIKDLEMKRLMCLRMAKDHKQLALASKDEIVKSMHVAYYEKYMSESNIYGDLIRDRKIAKNRK